MVAVSLTNTKVIKNASGALAFQTAKSTKVDDLVAVGSSRIWGAEVRFNRGAQKRNFIPAHGEQFEQKQDRLTTYSMPKARVTWHATPASLKLFLESLAGAWSVNDLQWKGGAPQKWLTFAFRDNEEGAAGRLEQLYDGIVHTLEIKTPGPYGEVELAADLIFERGTGESLATSTVKIPSRPGAADSAITFGHLAVELTRDPAGAAVRLNLESLLLRLEVPYTLWPYTGIEPLIVRSVPGVITVDGEVVARYTNEYEVIASNAAVPTLQDFRVKLVSGTSSLTVDLSGVDFETPERGWGADGVVRFEGKFKAHSSGGVESTKIVKAGF